MGVFGDWAGKYHDLGINVLPIAEEKRPPKGFKFQHWLERKQTEEEIEDLIKNYGHYPGIGIVCGAVSGICGFDFDYKYDEQKMNKMSKSKWELDNKMVESAIKSYLPSWTLAKKAAEGWTVFFKHNDHFKTLGPQRNGVRLFDFKASGYIVVPPSFHSNKDGKQIYYHWIIGDPMEEFANLPEVDFGAVEDLVLTFGDGSHKKKEQFNNRHGRLYLFGRSLAKIENSVDKIAAQMIDYDKKIHAKEPKGPYFSDKKHCGYNPEQYALKWAQRIYDSLKHNARNESSKENEQEVFDYFFAHKFKYGAPKKDILTKKIFYRHPTEARWASGEELESSLISYARSAGLKASEVKPEFARFQEEYGNCDFLVDIPKHDGVDYLRTHIEALRCSAFTHDELYEIFLNWGNLLFKRIHDSDTQNRCIILKGSQGIGKDAWIKTICKDFRPYYQPLDVSRDPVEMISAVQKLFIAHVSEFDQTKKLDVSFIKALITNPTSFIREKYGRVALERPMRASWISSVNIDNILRDASGNRRFIVLPIESIVWDYPKPGIKILAQFKDAFERGLGQTVSASTEAKIKAIVDSLTPDDMNEDIEALFLERLEKELLTSKFDKKVSSTAMSQHVSDVAKTFQVSVNRVYAVVKKYKRRSGDSRFYSK